jgi:NAD(P)-dependent dehydrogenase (short-subunit alcohol dehydrogenase family)
MCSASTCVFWPASSLLSVASWVNGGELAAYAASKSAAWSLTNALRNAGNRVLDLHGTLQVGGGNGFT